MAQENSLNSFSEYDLKCEFPARESFRESLLSRVLAMNEMKRHVDSSDDLNDEQDDLMQADDIDDSDLKMLAAAQGEIQNFKKLREK